MIKIVAITTVYNPDFKELKRNIESYVQWIDYLVLWNNSPEVENELKELVYKIDNPNIEIRSTGVNEYLSLPFNQCIKWAREKDYTHLLTMDQDSYFQNDDFEKYINEIEKYQDTNIAIYSPFRKTLSRTSKDIDELEHTITSGAIFPINVFYKLGLFREDFCIYMVDMEFCLRARHSGFRIVQMNNVNLIHQEGYAIKTKLGITLNSYSAQSTYFIIRNTILVWKLYPSSISFSNRWHFIKYKIIFRTIKLFFEPNSLKKYKAIFLGIYHGLKEHSGKFNL